ncbi:MAG: hypothetical protein KAI64_07355 [Thermoplasmata archaeon]|nr:hypothetical protein [Thermoplasmata archaeon]
MLQPCEVMTVKIMPMVRALIVNALMDEHGLKQTEVSDLLGITQASVSHYRTKKRAYDRKVLKQFPELQSYAKALSEKLIEEKDSNRHISLFCTLCRDLRSTEEFCSFHRNTSELKDCNICFEDPDLNDKR